MVEAARMTRQWPVIKGIISDLDGVVYRGSEPVLDAIRAFKHWQRMGIPYCFVTNNSTRSTKDVVAKLNGFGVEVTTSNIVTSAIAAALLVSSRWPSSTHAYVIGAPELHEVIRAVGFVLTETAPEVVIIGLDREITHHKLHAAVEAIRNGAVLIGTNPDLLLPTETGFEPGAGAILTAVAAASRTTPIIAGKPEVHMIEMALRRLGTAREATLMIGDQVTTDIQAGKRAGVCSVLVTTGAPAASGPDDFPPDFTVKSLTDIPIERLL